MSTQGADMNEINLPPLPERDTSKPTEQQGVFRKFDVRRTDGSSEPDGKHHGCEYFVLDVTHDTAAPAALAAYADAVEATHPALAADMRARYAVEKDRAELGGVPADSAATGKMTHQRAKFFMLRFKAEEKLLGPNEQAAIEHIINLLEREQYAAPQPQPVQEAQPVDMNAMQWMEQRREYLRGLSFKDSKITAELESIHRAIGAIENSAEPFAHICVLPTKDAGPTKFFTAPSDPRGFPVYTSPPPQAAQPVQREPLAPSMEPFKCPVCGSSYFGPLWKGKEHVGRYCKGWPSGHDRSYIPCKGRHEELFVAHGITKKGGEA